MACSLFSMRVVINYNSSNGLFIFRLGNHNVYMDGFETQGVPAGPNGKQRQRTNTISVATNMFNVLMILNNTTNYYNRCF